MTDSNDQEVLRDQLKNVQYPGLNRDIVSFGFIEQIDNEQGDVTVSFNPSTDRDDLIEQMSDDIKSELLDLENVQSVSVRQVESESSGGSPTSPESGENGAGQKVAAAAPGATESPGSGPMDRQPIPGIDNIIAVASGKGGVGKSTVAVNLAAALREQGYSVALGDMDIYGPSSPTMMGVKDRPRINENEDIIPLKSNDVEVMSIGFVLDETEPVVWRGPMVMKAVTQFLRDVDWGDHDYMIIDLPPGTGDAQLTLMQKVPLSGAVIVTTPQDVALIDAQKGVEMFRKLDVPILGIVENMSVYSCPECGHESEIFGSGGGRKEAMRLNVPFLGGVPIHPEIREGGDSGEPIVWKSPENEASDTFHEIANEVRERAVPVEQVLEDTSGTPSAST
ncbi:MAG: P-loop NTPase [bacterium]